MDASRFDRLTLRFGEALSRRHVGGLLVALGLSAGAGFAVEIDARRKKKKGNKKKAKKCKKGAVKCGKACVNTKNNALHCGSCGQRCGDNRACVNGQCQTGCPGNQILCVGLCVDPNDNEEHCGDCNNPCADPLTCVDGQCDCAEGTRCGNDCVDTQTDDDHCRECDNACGSGKRCVAGECTESACGPGEQDCGGGLCIEEGELACCGPADCGGDFQDLECNRNTHRCECFQTRVIGPGWGICERFEGGGGLCGPCCPGGIELGDSCPVLENRDRVCVSQAIDGCQCPQSMPVACPTPSMSGFCSVDLDSDPLRCGQDCQNCIQFDSGTRCCSGHCVRGCAPNTNGSCLFEPCGNSCEVCLQGTMCCNRGPGTSGECVPAGTFCPLPG